MKKLLSVLIYFLLTSCNEQGTLSSSKAYFDLKDFFVKQENELIKSKVFVRKKIFSDNKTEQIIMEDVDWKKELIPFSSLDINNPVWKLSYSIDTLKSISNYSVVYTAKEDKLSVKKMILTFQNDSLKIIDIDVEKKNAYFHSLQKLIYTVEYGFTISGGQKIIFTDSTNYVINAEFVKQ